MPRGKSTGVDKFITLILPRLGDVLDWARAGADEKEIAKLLEVPYSTFRSWVKKGRDGEERYAPLAAVLEQGQSVPNSEVEAALYKRAVGYTARERVEEIRQNQDGEVTGRIVKHYEKHVPPDPTSAIFLLTNREPGRWSKSPGEREDGGEEAGVIEIARVQEGKAEGQGTGGE